MSKARTRRGFLAAQRTAAGIGQEPPFLRPALWPASSPHLPPSWPARGGLAAPPKGRVRPRAIGRRRPSLRQRACMPRRAQAPCTAAPASRRARDPAPRAFFGPRRCRVLRPAACRALISPCAALHARIRPAIGGGLGGAAARTVARIHCAELHSAFRACARKSGRQEAEGAARRFPLPPAPACRAPTRLRSTRMPAKIRVEAHLAAKKLAASREFNRPLRAGARAVCELGLLAAKAARHLPAGPCCYGPAALT